MSEADWQAKVIDAAHLHGWRVAHFRPAKTQRKDGSVFHQTPVGADGKGWPDLVLVHPNRGVVFAELKAEREGLKPEQVVWRDRLLEAGADWFMWKPSDWPAVQITLTRPPRTR